jgi:hypothetical protein
MEAASKRSLLTRKFKQLVMLLVLLEVSALASLLLTEDSVQMEQIKAQVQTLLNDPTATKDVQHIRSWRIGPYQQTQMTFLHDHRRKLVVHASHWWGFQPTITCLSNASEDHCQ